MTLRPEVEAGIEKYLAQVRAELADRPESETESLLADLREHLHEELRRRNPKAPTAEDLAAMLRDMDPPSAYAGAAVEPAGGPPSRRANRWFRLALCFLLLNGAAVWKWWAQQPARDGAVLAQCAPAANVTLEGRTPIRWSFTEDMIPADRAGSAATEKEASLRPAVPGRWTWTDPRTLEFAPAADWPACQVYEAALGPELTALSGRPLAGERSIRLSAAPLRLLISEQVNLSPERAATIRLTFNAPPEKGALQKFLTIRTPDGKAVTFEPAGEGGGAELMIRTAPVDSDDLMMTLDQGLPARNAPLGLAQPQSWKLTLTESLRLQRLNPQSPAFESCIVNAYFTAPVEAASATAFIEFQPAVKFTVESPAWWAYNGCKIVGDFEPGRIYTITFKAGLRSVNGVQLANSVARQIQFPDRPASLAFAADGRYLSPQGPLTIPLRAMNVKDYTIRVREVLPQNLVMLAQREADYYGLDSAANRLTRSLCVVTNTIDGRPNVETEQKLDLRKLLGGARIGGVYLLTAQVERGPSSQQLVVVSDLGIAARRSDDGFLVWVNSLSAAAPAAGCRITVYADNNEAIGSGQSDTNGLAFIRVPESDDARPLLIVAEREGDSSFISLDATWVQPPDAFEGRFWPATPCEAFVFTDRGIYRPGETAYLHALVRDAGLRAPEPFPVVLRILKPDGRPFRDIPVMPGDWGAVATNLVLPDYLPTGRYTLQLALPGDGPVLGDTEFSVEDFVPPQIRVRIADQPARVTPTNALTFAASAEHLFGRAASGLAANGRVSIEPVAFAPTNWAGYAFGDGERAFSTLELPAGNAPLDEDGRAQFKADLSAAWRPPAALKALLCATVIEGSGRPVTAYASSWVDVYPYYIGLKTADGRTTVRTGEERHLAVAAVRPDGGPANDVGPLHFRISRATWSSVLRRRSDGRYAYQSERQLTVVREGSVTLANGKGDLAFALDAAGEYVLAVFDPDAGTSSSMTLQAASPDEEWIEWSLEKPDRVELAPDRDTYRAGDTAHLTIKAPFSGSALLTVEGERIRETRLVRLEKNTAVADVAIATNYAPGVYCSLTLIRPAAPEAIWTAHRAVGLTRLNVVEPERRLNVALEAPEKIRPQSQLATRVRLTDDAGQPAAGEVIVMAVDEAICMLTDFETPDPDRWFQSPREPIIEQYDLYSLLMPLIEERAGGAASHIGGDGEDTLMRRLNPIRSKRFKPIAVCAAPVRASSNGWADVRLNIPEFTGQLRLMAVAYNRDQSGAADRKVLVKRPVVAEFSLPRFLAPGDECRASLQLFNESGSNCAVSARVTVQGPLSVDKPERAWAMAAGKSLTEDFLVTAGEQVGVANVTLDVSFGGERYSDTLELAVRPSRSRERCYRLGRLKPGESTLVAPDDGWIPVSVFADLRCSTRPDIQLAAPLEELMQYPYGCLEQTVSEAFPLLYLPDLAAQLLPNSVGRDEVASFVEPAILRVLSMQRDNGGFALWPNQISEYSWGSIYATHFLVEARRAGYAVPSERLDAALKYLRDRLGRAAPTDVDPKDADWQNDMEERAYAVEILALAGQPDSGWMARLREYGDRLRSSSQAHLAAGLILAGEPKAGLEWLRRIGLPPDRPPAIGGALGSRAGDAALMLSALMDIAPDDALAPQLATLLNELQKNGQWESTHDNALALMALGKYARAAKSDARLSSIRLNDAAGWSQAFANTNDALCRVPATAAYPVSVSNSGPGAVYFSFAAEGIPVEGAETEADDGMTLRREWLDLEGDALNIDTIAQGTPAVVRLTLDTLGQALDNIVIEDLLPAGLEIENADLATSQQVSWIKTRSSWCARAEARDDRMLLFTGPVRGTFEYYYVVRAVTPGRYRIPALRGSCMYAPAIRSCRGGGSVEVTE